MLNTTNMAFIQSLSQFISSGISYRRDPAPSPYILSTSPPDASMELYVLEHRLQVCFIPKNAIADFCHAIMKIALLPDSRPNFFSITETDDGYTLIVTEEDFKVFPKHSDLQTCGYPWRVLTVSVGAMGESNELFGASKIAKSVIGPLADHKVSVLCLSTYQSDFILVQEPHLDDTIKCLGSYFKIYNDDHKRVNCTQILSSSPSSPSLTGDPRTVNHPFKSPSDQYHITGLDASKLTGVIQVLLELIFFSGNKENETNTFFHFSTVNGDISLMLDNDAIKKFPNNVLYTKKNEDIWRMITIGDEPLGFEECGIVAQVVEPLATLQVSTYYVSTYNVEYCMVLEKDIDRVLNVLKKLSCTGETVDGVVTLTEAEVPKNGAEQADNKNCELEQKEELRPGENMSLGQALENSSADERNHFPSLLSTSPQSPVSDDSSCGTSPVNSYIEIKNSYTEEYISSNPIPIPPCEPNR